MKAVVGIIIGVVVILAAAGAGVATGLVRPFTPAPQTNLQASPLLQPLPAQASATADLVVTISERYFNKQIAQNLQPGGQVQSAQMDLHPNNQANVIATIQVNSLLRLSPDASVQMSVQNGRVVIDITRVDVGGFGIPSSLIEPQIADLKETTERELNAQLADLERSTGLKLQSMTTTENSLTLFFGE